jgi:hypothetical protein
MINVPLLSPDEEPDWRKFRQPLGTGTEVFMNITMIPKYIHFSVEELRLRRWLEDQLVSGRREG